MDYDDDVDATAAGALAFAAVSVASVISASLALLSASFTRISSMPSMTLLHTGHRFVCVASIFAQSQHMHRCLHGKTVVVLGSLKQMTHSVPSSVSFFANIVPWSSLNAFPSSPVPPLPPSPLPLPVPDASADAFCAGESGKPDFTRQEKIEQTQFLYLTI